MTGKVNGGDPTKHISGLKLWRDIGKSTFVLSKAPDLEVFLDLVVEDTDPKRNEADLWISISGDRDDLRRIGLVLGGRAVRIGAVEAVEIGAGIRVGIGLRNGGLGVTRTGAHLAINAPREVWEIEREEVFAKRLIAARKAGKVRWLFNPPPQ